MPGEWPPSEQAERVWVKQGGCPTDAGRTHPIRPLPELSWGVVTLGPWPGRQESLEQLLLGVSGLRHPEPHGLQASPPLSCRSTASGRCPMQDLLGHPQSGSSEGLTPRFHTQTKPLAPSASWGLRHGLQRLSPEVPGSPAAFLQSQLGQDRGQSSGQGSAHSALVLADAGQVTGAASGCLPLNTESVGQGTWPLRLPLPPGGC